MFSRREISGLPGQSDCLLQAIHTHLLSRRLALDVSAARSSAVLSCSFAQDKRVISFRRRACNATALWDPSRCLHSPALPVRLCHHHPFLPSCASVSAWSCVAWPSSWFVLHPISALRPTILGWLASPAANAASAMLKLWLEQVPTLSLIIRRASSRFLSRERVW